MDGVLLDSSPVVERTWRRWAERHGLSAELILRIAHGRRTWDTLRAAAPALATKEEVAWLDAAEREDLDGVRPVPGAAVLVAALSSGQWTVVTSAGRDLAQLRLAAVGLLLPDHAITSEDVERGKPAPDGYLKAASRLGVPVDRCLVVEDAPAGIQAGLTAGAQVLAVATTHALDALTAADYIVRDLRSVQVSPHASRLVIHIESTSAAT